MGRWSGWISGVFAVGAVLYLVVFLAMGDPRSLINSQASLASVLDGTVSHYNVHFLSPNQGPERWAVTSDGYLETRHDRTYFIHRLPLIRGNLIQDSFTLHLEYLDRGTSDFRVGGFSAANPEETVWLATMWFDQTDAWRSVDIFVEDADALTNRFFITSGLVIRTLEIRRYEVRGVELGRFASPDEQQWLLRSDGYLEVVAPSICVESVAFAAQEDSHHVVRVAYREGNQDWRDWETTVVANSEEICPAVLGQHTVVKSLVVEPRLDFEPGQ